MFKDRHARVERKCEYCGDVFLARVERVNRGQGRFCSLKHANLFQQENDLNDVRGKEKGKKYWDGDKWTVHWYDDKAKVHVTSYARWWWEVNNNVELPKDIFVTMKDGNPENISPDNFIIISKKEFSILRGTRGTGSPHPSNAGEKNKWWRGGLSYEGYPNTFSKPLKKRIKIRDNFTCQCCFSVYDSMNLDVHHMDLNRKNNTSENLVTVCKSCHKGIHGKSSKTNDKIKYYQSLLILEGD